MHAGRIEPDEERLLVAVCAVSMKSIEASRNSSSIVSIRFLVERAGVLAFLLAPRAEARIVAGRRRSSVATHFSTPRGPNCALKAGSFG